VRQGWSFSEGEGMTRLLIRGGTIVTDQVIVKGSILAAEGIVTGLFADDHLDTTVDLEIDARGKLILPGAVDIHCHFREPDPLEREGFQTGSASAAAGGVTTVIEQPQATPPATTVAAFKSKRQLASEKSVVDFGLWGGIVAGNSDDLRAMHEEGAFAFKAYLAEGSPQLGILDDGELVVAMRTIAEFGGLLGVHAENNGLVRWGREEMERRGRTDPLAFAESRPILAEVEAVSRTALFARETGCRLHILHASCTLTVRAVKEHRAAGQAITVETCPHYLLLNDQALADLGPQVKCSPPLRPAAESEALWSHLAAGEIDILASDHAPYNASEKAAGNDDIFLAPSGAPSNETMLPLLLEEALYRRNVDLRTMVGLLAANPARLMGLYPRKGTLAIGSDADITIVDPEREWIVRGEALHGRQRWTPYEGRSCRVSVDTVLVRGEPVFQAGDVVAKPGSGKFLHAGSHS
jgi:allantoinase